MHYKPFIFEALYRYIRLSSPKKGEQQTERPQTSLTSVIITKHNVTRRVYVPDYSEFNNNRYLDDPELKQHYWAASFLLPLGSIIVLSVVVLLMVLFKRCPQIIAGIVTGLLTTTIIFIIVISMKNDPVYM